MNAPATIKLSTADVALLRRLKDGPALAIDRAHVEARVAAHVRFCDLYARQCRCESNVVPIDGGRQ